MNKECAGRTNLLIFCRIYEDLINKSLTHDSKHLAVKPVAQNADEIKCFVLTTMSNWEAQPQ